MKLTQKTLKLLNQTYQADTLIERHVGRHALAFKTDGFGKPVLLFLGKASQHGRESGIPANWSRMQMEK